MKMEKSFQKDFFHLFLFLSKNKRKNYTFLSKIYNYLNLKKKKVCFGNVDNNKFISMIIPNSYKYCKTKTIKKECLKKKKIKKKSFIFKF